MLLIIQTFMYKYFISLSFVLISVFGFAQGENEISTDSIIYKKTYGLRAGIDAASLIRTGIDPD